MQRRDFLKIGAASAASIALPAVALAEPHMHGDSIWKEAPETVEELDRCIQKYTNFLFDSSKAWEELHVQDSSGKWHTQNAVHIEYALGTGDLISESGKTPEQRLVRHMWVTARQLILNSRDEVPHLIWRRRPMIEDFSHDTLGAMKKIRMRLWLSGSPSVSFAQELPLISKKRPYKVIA